ncbi:hypothetical protein TNCV_2089951 [Trichonephila clavipes]|nr:hypothetical protein TNCV_2089951 [Trichonephila clavipes]
MAFLEPSRLAEPNPNYKLTTMSLTTDHTTEMDYQNDSLPLSGKSSPEPLTDQPRVQGLRQPRRTHPSLQSHCTGL